MEIILKPEELNDLLEKQKKHTISQMVNLASDHYGDMLENKQTLTLRAYREDLRTEATSLFRNKAQNLTLIKIH